MTTYDASATVPASALNAPILPEDKARASELWNRAKGTDLEQAYRDVSGQHPDKNGNRAAYLAFVTAIESLFVAPEAPVTPEPQDLTPEREDIPTSFRDFPLMSTAEDVARAEDEAESRMDDEADAALTGEGEDGPTPDGEVPAPEVEVGDTPEEHAPSAAPPQTTGTAAPDPAAPVQTLSAPPVHSGLLGQLAGTLADGGQLTLQLLRVGDQLTVGIFPQPHPGEQAAQPLTVTESPDWLDANLPRAMREYAQARRDAYAVCQEAARKQQTANKKAAEAKPAPGKTPGKGSAPKTFSVTLQAAEGSTLTAKQAGKDVALVIGENQVAQGNLEATVSHPLFGEQKKTLAVWGTKTHDFQEQQGGRVRVEVTPESAALTATRGETTLALHGETLLPTGKWTITAEAADHETATQSVTVKAGKAEVIQMALKETEMGSLF